MYTYTYLLKKGTFSAARTTLVIQNMSVLVCAVCIFFVITYKSEIDVYWPDEGLLILCYAGIIMIAVVSTLASMGTKIAVQKDWIVEICGRDKDALACKLREEFLTLLAINSFMT